MKIFDKTLTLLEHALDARLNRQNVLAGNLANLDTPGFKPRDLDFGRALAASESAASDGAASDGSAPGIAAPEIGSANAAIRSPGHIDLGGAPVVSGLGMAPTGEASPGLSTSAGIDGNGVDLDRTLVAMAQNGLLYDASAKAATKKLGILRFVANDGTS